jgi:hypothetical protein
MRLRNVAAGAALALAAVPALAAEEAEGAVESASPMVTVLFLAVFVGCLAVYLWMTLKNEKRGNRKKDPS